MQKYLLKTWKKKEKKLNAAYTGWENNFVRVLHRENLSGTFFSRYLQVAVQSLKQKRPSEGRQAAGRETQLCSCAATFCSIFWCSCSGTHKETSIVSHPFGKLSLQPPTQRLWRKCHHKVAVCRLCALQFPLPWAVPYARSHSQCLFFFPGCLCWCSGCFGCFSFLPQASGIIRSSSFGYEVTPAGGHLMRACIQCLHLPTHVSSLGPGRGCLSHTPDPLVLLSLYQAPG